MCGMYTVAVQRLLVRKSGIQHQIRVGGLQSFNLHFDLHKAGDLSLQSLQSCFDLLFDLLLFLLL